MTTFSPFRKIAITAAITVSLVLAGCATTPLTGSSDNAHQARVSTFKGAGIGCALGGVAGLLMGHGGLANAAKGCAVGGVAGGTIAYIHVYREQLDKANAAKVDAAKHGLTATVITTQVTAKDDQGKQQPTDAVDRLSLPIPLTRIYKHDANVAEVIARTVAVADTGTRPTTLTISGPAKARTWLDAQVASDLKPASTVKIVDVDASAAAIEISPVPGK